MRCNIRVTGYAASLFVMTANDIYIIIILQLNMLLITLGKESVNNGVVLITLSNPSGSSAYATSIARSIARWDLMDTAVSLSPVN